MILINTWAMKVFARQAGIRDGESGQTMAEYAVILAVISVAIVATLLVLSGNIDAVLTRIAGAIK